MTETLGELSDIFVNNVLAEVGRSATQIRELLCGFLPMQGHAFQDRRSLMVVGRAANGWDKPIEAKLLADVEQRRNFAEAVTRSVTGDGKCPMTWVTGRWEVKSGYNTRKSAFWRVVRAVTGRLDIAHEEPSSWPSRLVWSNLYKVSPFCGGNPTGVLKDAQHSGCVRLLQKEFETFRPHKILFLTGWDWAEPFLSPKNNNGWTFEPVHPATAERVQRVGWLRSSNHATQCVVACHPQGRTDEETVREIADAFQRAERVVAG